MITRRLIALILLLCTLGCMAAACTTIAPPGYDGASEQRALDEMEWQNDPWF